MLDDELFKYFAANPSSVADLWSLSSRDTDPMFGPLVEFLNAIPASEIKSTIENDEKFRSLYLRDGQEPAKTQEIAKVWYAEQFIRREIAARRLSLLRDTDSELRPEPYSRSSLSDLSVGKDHLVPLRSFAYDGSRLTRNGDAFMLLSTTGSPNSTYWLLAAFYKTAIDGETSVRLDPYLFGPEDVMPAVFYRMIVYGRPLDWARIASMKDQEHGRWRPSRLSKASEFTEFCWTRRGDEVHFVCEEVPTSSDVLTSAARYLHAVYDPEEARITHFDGALRLYTPDELTERHRHSVRSAGKVGLREKVFRIDKPVSREAFCLVTQAFFVWNYDIQNYFGTLSV